MTGVSAGLAGNAAPPSESSDEPAGNQPGSRAAAEIVASRLAEEVPPREHARRVCLSAFRGAHAPPRSLLVHIGERASTIVFAARVQPVAFWNLRHVLLRRVLERAAPGAGAAPEQARLLRAAARETVRPARLVVLRGLGLVDGIVTSGIARAIVRVAPDGGGSVPLAGLALMVEHACFAWSSAGLPGFARDCAAALLVGSVVLEAVGEQVGLRAFVTRF